MTRHLSLFPLQAAISPKRRTALAALLKHELHDDNLELIFFPRPKVIFCINLCPTYCCLFCIIRTLHCMSVPGTNSRADKVIILSVPMISCFYNTGQTVCFLKVMI